MTCCKVRLRVEEQGGVTLGVRDPASVTWSSDEYIPYHTTELPDYEGEYEVIPRLSPQVLATNERVMRSDMTIDGIPSYRTTNPSGGYTVIIAQD